MLSIYSKRKILHKVTILDVKIKHRHINTSFPDLFIIFRAPFGVLRLNLFRLKRFLYSGLRGLPAFAGEPPQPHKNLLSPSKGYHFARRRLMVILIND